jgi:hypothetical protein
VENKPKSKIVDGKWVKSENEYEKWLVNFTPVR